MYDVSREMHKFQRLFTSNVLREWNDSYAKKLIPPPIESIEELNPVELVEKPWIANLKSTLIGQRGIKSGNSRSLRWNEEKEEKCNSRAILE